MGKLISIAVTLVFLAAATGNLPVIIRKVRIAQINLLQESQASKWPKAMTLPAR